MKRLPANVVEGVLAQLGPAQSERVRSRMERLEEEPGAPEALDQVLVDFENLLIAAGSGAVVLPETLTSPKGKEKDSSRGGKLDRAKKKTMSPAAATETERTPEAAAPAESTSGADPLALLRDLDVDRLATALKDELPRTISLVLNNLEANLAGEVLKRLPPELRVPVSVQLGKAAIGSADLLQRIGRAVYHKAQSLKDNPAEEKAEVRFKKMADILRILEKTDRAEVLAALEQSDAETATKIKEFLYQFEDLLLIEDRSMQKLLSEVDSKSLASALKGATEEIKERVLNNLSKRARESLTEEMEFLGSIPASQIQEAQKMVVGVIQRLDQAGELVMKES